MNLQHQERFYQFMNRVKANERSRAASSTPANEKENETVTEVMNGLIVTRPAKKIEHLSTTRTTTTTTSKGLESYRKWSGVTKQGWVSTRE